MGSASQELTERAKLLISERRYDEAVRACRRALLSKPDQVEIRLLLGEALLALERYDEVRVEMIALSRKSDDNPAVHRLLGEAYLRDHRPQQAVESLRRALALDPRDEVAQELLKEAADDNAPISTTIERWFSDETPEPERLPPSSAAIPAADPLSHSDAGRYVAPPPLTPRFDPAGGGAPFYPEPSWPSHHDAPHNRPPSHYPPPPEDDPMAGFDLLAPPEDELENEPTRAISPHQPAPRIRDLDDDFEAAPTRALEIKDVEEQLTRAIATPESGMPPAMPAHPLVESEEGFEEPPTRAFISASELERANARADDALKPGPQASLVQYETPSISAVLPPNEETDAGAESAKRTKKKRRSKRGWGLPIAISVIALLIIAGAGAFALTRWLAITEVESIRAEAAAAGDSGSHADLQVVVNQITPTTPPELRALRARLLGTLALEHGEDHNAEITEIVNALPQHESFNDAEIAAALIALAAGDPDAALQRLSGLEVEDDQIPEAFRARALALAAKGSWSLSADAAQRAYETRPQAPRHLALHAWLRHRTNNTASARALLEGFEGAATQPAIRVTLARVLVESGADPEKAELEATAVISELADTASPYQLAWAHLVRAYYEAERGNRTSALEDADAAARSWPPGDEGFGMRLVNTYLLAGRPELAGTQLERLPTPAVDARGRALLAARVALANNDLDRADEAIAQAGEGVSQSLIRARILEQRGNFEAARPLYEDAMNNDPGPEGRSARVRLAAVEFAAGNPDVTIRYLEPIRGEAVDDLQLIPLLARAYIAEGRGEEARPVLETALTRRPSAPELLSAQGELLLLDGNNEEARDVLARAARMNTSDARLQSQLGQAAFLSGDLDQARTAWETALQLDATEPTALVGLARLAMADRAYDEVTRRLAAAEETGEADLAVAELRAELLVRRGEGHAGVEVVRALVEAHEDNAALWTALGVLQVQAEADRDAARSLERALRIDPNRPDTLLALAQVHTRRGNLGGARSAVSAATSAAEERGLTQALRVPIKIAQARIQFEAGDWGAVTRLVREALEIDERAAAAHLLLANMAIEGRGEGEPIDHLRAAAAGDAPPPEALGQLAHRLPESDHAEACRLARRYLAVAPSGYDAPDVRRVSARCH